MKSNIGLMALILITAVSFYGKESFADVVSCKQGPRNRLVGDAFTGSFTLLRNQLEVTDVSLKGCPLAITGRNEDGNDRVYPVFTLATLVAPISNKCFYTSNGNSIQRPNTRCIGMRTKIILS